MMRWKRWIPLVVFLAGIGLAFWYGQRRGEARPSTAEELAEVLRAHGIPYDSATQIADGRWTFTEIDDALTLTGEGTHVEILRIDDAETFEAAERASSRFASFQGGIVLNPQKVTRVFTRRPFVVVIREEPMPGQIVAILEEVLPDGVG
jgi:hypothetical protein